MTVAAQKQNVDLMQIRFPEDFLLKIQPLKYFLMNLTVFYVILQKWNTREMQYWCFVYHSYKTIHSWW